MIVVRLRNSELYISKYSTSRRRVSVGGVAALMIDHIQGIHIYGVSPLMWIMRDCIFYCDEGNVEKWSAGTTARFEYDLNLSLRWRSEGDVAESRR